MEEISPVMLLLQKHVASSSATSRIIDNLNSGAWLSVAWIPSLILRLPQDKVKALTSVRVMS